jgi:hypothetical protein
VGCTSGSRGEVPGEGKPVIRAADYDNKHDDDDYNNGSNNNINITIGII